jgi:hypothetical protein
MMRQLSEHQAGHNGHGETEKDIARVVRRVLAPGVSGAVVTRDTDADQHERCQRDHHTAEDQ